MTALEFIFLYYDMVLSADLYWRRICVGAFLIAGVFVHVVRSFDHATFIQLFYFFFVAWFLVATQGLLLVIAGPVVLPILIHFCLVFYLARRVHPLVFTSGVSANDDL